MDFNYFFVLTSPEDLVLEEPEQTAEKPTEKEKEKGQKTRVLHYPTKQQTVCINNNSAGHNQLIKIELELYSESDQEENLNFS